MAKPTKKPASSRPPRVEKCPTGIDGFDNLTGGGLPRHRVTLISGGPGSGKTLFGISFLVAGAARFGEHGVILSFDEGETEVLRDVASVDLDLMRQVDRGAIAIEHVSLDVPAPGCRGEFNLEGLIIRLENAIDAIGAKRVVLDTIDALFTGIGDDMLARLEVSRLFRWLKAKHVTTIVTGELGGKPAAHRNAATYAADCVIKLDHRIRDQVASRQLQIVKYRGSGYGPDEQPFIIGDAGLAMVPSASLTLDQPGTSTRVSTGVPSLDGMFKGQGLLVGSATLVSGGAGTGKSSIAAAFALAACERGERALYVSYEESAGQLVSNMRSISLDLERPIAEGRLRVLAVRPTYYGLERHLHDIYEAVQALNPHVAVIDPVSALMVHGSLPEARAMITRTIDLFKRAGITSMFTSLTPGGLNTGVESEAGIAWAIDTWIAIRDIEDAGQQRRRGLLIMKSRGTGHSNVVHTLLIRRDGIQLVPPHTILDRPEI